MRLSFPIRPLLPLPCLPVPCPPSRRAPVSIGSPIKVVPAAFSEGETGDDTLQVGDPLVRDAFVRTDRGGSTELRFIDETELEVKPGSRVKLDRFVFDDEKTFSNAGVMMLRGGFRWPAVIRARRPMICARRPPPSAFAAPFSNISVTAGGDRDPCDRRCEWACASDAPACIDADPSTGRCESRRTARNSIQRRRRSSRSSAARRIRQQ